MTSRINLGLAAFWMSAAIGFAQTPPPNTQWADWPTSWAASDPGPLSMDGQLDKPAGNAGNVLVRGGHFYVADKRLRLWGVNIAFGANFPTHDLANQLAWRFARYGINAVRLHHMDNQPFPNGIFADATLSRLSPEALDRLDYFVAALKQQGIYVDVNLHVSRGYRHYHTTPDGKDGPAIDKIVDIFDPVLIAAQKQYAHDLLTHVNAYTHYAYAAEPSVAIVEINNENSLFMWGAGRTLTHLPPVYATELQNQWNDWLLKKYGSRDALVKTWTAKDQPTGPELLGSSAWSIELHDTQATVRTTPQNTTLSVKRTDGTDWHVQYHHPKLPIQLARQYVLSFTASANKPVTIQVGLSQAHAPWQQLGESQEVQIGVEPKRHVISFVANADDANGRVVFMLGNAPAEIVLSNLSFHAGGLKSIADDEDPQTRSVHVGLVTSHLRRNDWLEFLSNTEDAYFLGMMKYLKNDLRVSCPITGTIGFGPLATNTQSKMDFVDAHAYWQHPTFTHRDWDMNDWTVPNTPMVDAPSKGTLWELAANRVEGKPFTVTEYQHPAPSDWQAECIPMIASYAAMQDWDGVFIFAYSHDRQYDKGHIASFFDIEGNPGKMPFMPVGARIFFNTTPAPAAQTRLEMTRESALEGSVKFQTDSGSFFRNVANDDSLFTPNDRLSISFGRNARVDHSGMPPSPISADWTSIGAGTGRYVCSSPASAVFVGSSAGQFPVDLKIAKIESIKTPFAVLTIVPAEVSDMVNSDRLIVTAVGRVENSGMAWNPARTSVGSNFGSGPQIEVVQGTLTFPGNWAHAYALDPAGKPAGDDLAQRIDGGIRIVIGTNPGMSYLISK